MLRISQIIKEIGMADQTALFNSVINRADFLSKVEGSHIRKRQSTQCPDCSHTYEVRDYTDYIYFNSDIIGLCKALCEELELLHKRIDEIEGKAKKDIRLDM